VPGPIQRLVSVSAPPFTLPLGPLLASQRWGPLRVRSRAEPIAGIRSQRRSSEVGAPKGFPQGLSTLLITYNRVVHGGHLDLTARAGDFAVVK